MFFGQRPAAQSSTFAPTFALFERYLGALREQAGIPGLAAAIIQNGNVAWSRGFGVANTSSSAPVMETTPFPIADLSQTVAASLVLRECIDRGEADLDDAVQRWSPGFSDRTATFRDVLSHTGPGGYNFSRTRFEALTGAVEECADRPYAVAVISAVLDEYVMNRAVPGGEVLCCDTPLRLLLPAEKLRTYNSILQEMAGLYRVDGSRRATVSAYQLPPLNAANGLVASMSDLIRFDNNLDVIVRRSTLDNEAWVRQRGSPMGLGWFVQHIGTKRVVWHFGDEPGAASSLMIKLPDEGLTLILLANSDGLSVGLPLKNGDVTVSPFAKIFFSLLG